MQRKGRWKRRVNESLTDTRKGLISILVFSPNNLKHSFVVDCNPMRIRCNYTVFCMFTSETKHKNQINLIKLYFLDTPVSL